MKLSNPPINEVVCGVLFTPVEQLTPVVHGVYWHERQEDFPAHKIHPAVDDLNAPFRLGPTPLRTWLIAEDETRLIQIQHDRFFANWRKRNPQDEYPRFSEHSGVAGVSSFAIDEFRRFYEFCETQGFLLKPTHAELSKIDIFKKGAHWQDSEDLSDILPILAQSLKIAGPGLPSLNLSLTRADDVDRKMNVSLVSGVSHADNLPIIRMETRIRMTVHDKSELPARFDSLNSELNDVFFAMIPASALKRFEVEKEER